MQLNVREVSKLLKVSERKVYDWIKRGILRADRVNDQYRLHRSDLLEQTSSREIDITAHIFEAPSAAGFAIHPLADALRAGGIFYGLQGDHKAAVLSAIVNSLSLPSNTDRGSLAQLLLAREALGSTAIGEGIAIPHVRRPILLNASKPAISLCFLHASHCRNIILACKRLVKFQAKRGIGSLFRECWLFLPPTCAMTSIFFKSFGLWSGCFKRRESHRRASDDSIIIARSPPAGSGIAGQY